MCFKLDFQACTILVPNGAKAKPIILKCWTANGIPTIVIAQMKAANKWPIAIYQPPKNIQRIFRSIFPAPVGSLSILRPKGQIVKAAILKAAIPNGIPIIVRHIMKPANSHSIVVQNPPKIIHNKFPIRLKIPAILSPLIDISSYESALVFTMVVLSFCDTIRRNRVF